MRIVLFCAVLLFGGCSNIAVTKLVPEANTPATAAVGESIVRWSWILSPLPGSRGWQKELVYLGADGPRLRVGYREYANAYSGAGWLVKPGRSTDLVFNMNDGKEIAYDGARVRVESWSPTSISYLLTAAPSTH